MVCIWFPWAPPVLALNLVKTWRDMVVKNTSMSICYNQPCKLSWYRAPPLKRSKWKFKIDLKNRMTLHQITFINRSDLASEKTIQGSRIRFVIGCVIPRAGAVARSRNLGQALFGSPVYSGTVSQHLASTSPVWGSLVRYSAKQTWWQSRRLRSESLYLWMIGRSRPGPETALRRRRDWSCVSSRYCEWTNTSSLTQVFVENEWAQISRKIGPDIFVPKHESSIFRSFIQPCMWFLHDGTG